MALIAMVRPRRIVAIGRDAAVALEGIGVPAHVGPPLTLELRRLTGPVRISAAMAPAQSVCQCVPRLRARTATPAIF
jgi:hypothetical protein